MIAIADSGATKTEWRFLQPDGVISQANSKGINPFYQTAEQIAEIIQQAARQAKGTATEVHFYGAGCNTDNNINTVSHALATAFEGAQVAVHHDLLAAAHALCGHQPGIACILGTGSNSCLYDGTDLIDQVPSLGFMLGDEGSGAVLGKTLVNAYLKRGLPERLVTRFEKRYTINEKQVLEQVYQNPMPSQYLAGFSQFLFHNMKDPFIYKLVYECFAAFFEKNVMRYPNYQQYKVHFTGSVAFYYANILRRVAQDKRITVQNIIEGPIAGLTLYYQNKQ